MRKTPKDAVRKAKRRIDSVILFKRICIFRLYLYAKTITYKDIIIPIVPQTKMSLDKTISDWKEV